VTLPEKALITEIRRIAKSGLRLADGRIHRRQTKILTGIGDDCAVLRVGAGADTLVTTDFSLEGVHFRRDWQSPESVGHRCLARGLSDIAAMGGDPAAVFLSLALPRELPQSWARRFVRGLSKLAAQHGAILAGGDTAQSPDGILADIIVLGSAPKGKAVLRSGARPGDRIFVSGELGGSAAAVLQMQKDPTAKLAPQYYRRHFYPDPRIELGRLLREKGLASAMIDTSDGLSTDLAHICEESGAGAEVEAGTIPRAQVGKRRLQVDLDLALHGGEDYELLFTVRPGKRVPQEIAGVVVTEIGRILRGRKMLLRSADGSVGKLVIGGWEHFRQ
jgi:thiamine-monophosphate kinase